MKKFESLKEAKLNKQSVSKLRIDKSEIGSEKDQVASTDYLVLLINMTQHCMVLGRVNNGKWFAIPRVCRNCDSDPDTCFDQGKYSPVLNCQCTDAPFNLTLATEPDSDGNAVGATWQIRPNCQYAGGVIALG